ncbi:MAG: GNAT family N-acetyltransferase [Candidatus Diapherotrites archaeon]|nr:GNAT family N-acetyltransferase [Candidatus Diapherotrites archaeon]
MPFKPKKRGKPSKLRKLMIFKNKYDVSLPTFIGREIKQGVRNLRYAARWRGIKIEHLDLSKLSGDELVRKHYDIKTKKFKDPRMENFFKLLEKTFNPDYFYERDDYVESLKEDDYHITFAIDKKTGELIGGAMSSVGKLKDGSHVMFPEYIVVEERFRAKGLGTHMFNKHYREIRKRVGGKLRERLARRIKGEGPPIKYVVGDVRDEHMTNYQPKIGYKSAGKFAYPDEWPEELEKTNLLLIQTGARKHKTRIPSDEINKVLEFLAEGEGLEGEELKRYLEDQGLPPGIEIKLKEIKKKKQKA